MSVFIEIESLLIDVEAELRRLQLWDSEPPSADALASTEPFCVDTLTFTQWLQFIFLPRMRMLCTARQLPPGRCDIKPLAEQYFSSGRLDVLALVRALGELDQCINRLIS